MTDMTDMTEMYHDHRTTVGIIRRHGLRYKLDLFRGAGKEPSIIEQFHEDPQVLRHYIFDLWPEAILWEK